MARMPRIVVPGLPHHVTQRGGRSQPTFFSDADYARYRELVVEARTEGAVAIWAYCLMPNHVHLIAVPGDTEGLAGLFRVAHRRYTREINRRENWRGHLWQERFYSAPLDERHLLAAVRYVELNPVRAGLCPRPEDWPWSSVHAHLGRSADPLVDPGPMLERISDWRGYLGLPETAAETDAIRHRSRTGRPAGSDAFVAELEQRTGRRLHLGKRGPKAVK